MLVPLLDRNSSSGTGALFVKALMMRYSHHLRQHIYRCAICTRIEKLFFKQLIPAMTLLAYC